MAVPSSGELELYNDIGTELGVAQSNVTLHGMSQTAGFSAPDAMSEFYGYSAVSSPISTVIYTGTSTLRSVTGVGFKPDLVWVKSRSNAVAALIQDSVRGTYAYSLPAYNISENTNSNRDWFRSFDSDGFTLGPYYATSGEPSANLNESGYTYVAWCFKAGGAAVTNTSGSITSQVSANVDGGFSIVTYSGNSANGTVGHGLGVTPNIVLTKSRNNISNWSFNGNIGSLVYGSNKMLLNGTSGITTDTNEVLAANSSTFTAGSSSAVGRSGYTYVAYCFAEKSGYSKFGSYIGNGSTSGPTITTGFEPAFIMVKRSDATGNWVMLDNKRATSNPRNKALWADLNNAEATGYSTDFNSTNFQIKDSGSALNLSGGTYIYMAFA